MKKKIFLKILVMVSQPSSVLLEIDIFQVDTDMFHNKTYTGNLLYNRNTCLFNGYSRKYCGKEGWMEIAKLEKV